MKLVKKLVVEKRYVESNTIKYEIVCNVADEVLLETDNILEIGIYFVDELRMSLDYSILLKAQERMESGGYAVLCTKKLSDQERMNNGDESYYFDKDYVIEK